MKESTFFVLQGKRRRESQLMFVFNLSSHQREKHEIEFKGGKTAIGTIIILMSMNQTGKS